MQIKFIYSEKAQNFAKYSPYFWLALHRTKVRSRFRKMLWPSQNIWTLTELTGYSYYALSYPFFLPNKQFFQHFQKLNGWNKSSICKFLRNLVIIYIFSDMYFFSFIQTSFMLTSSIGNWDQYKPHTLILPDWTLEKWARSNFTFQSS